MLERTIVTLQQRLLSYPIDVGWAHTRHAGGSAGECQSRRTDFSKASGRDCDREAPRRFVVSAERQASACQQTLTVSCRRSARQPSAHCRKHCAGIRTRRDIAVLHVSPGRKPRHARSFWSGDL